MNIDEKLEALTHSVELLAHMQQETEKRIQALITLQSQTDEHMDALGNYVHQIGRIVLNHEDRLRELEGNDGDSEDQPTN